MSEKVGAVIRVAGIGVLFLVLSLLATACGSGGSDSVDTTVAVGSAEACVGLADRWVFLQQRLLDGLDASGQLDPVETQNNAAAMLEQARDAEARGCTVEVAVGAPLICERVGQLQADSPAAEVLVADLAAKC